MDTKVTIPAPYARTDKRSQLYRYGQLVLLVLAAGAIYPVLYLRQIYQTSMIEALAINDQQLGYLYSILGAAFMLSYLPSGWLADRIAPRLLISVSLLGTGLLAMGYATLPDFQVLLAIFCGFGITTGLTFWAALLKRVKLLASKQEQGRFFGVLDGGRGLVEALLATVAISLFTYLTHDRGVGLADGFRHVIHLYAYTCLALGIVLGLLRDPQPAARVLQARQARIKGSVLQDLKQLAGLPELWLVTAIVFCGYHFFWATYSFSAYLEQGGLGLSATMAGVITTIKLWMRPVGGIGGGWLGDRFTNLRVLTWALALAGVGMLGLITLPKLHIVSLVVVLVVFIGLMTYAIRGLYWAVLDQCQIPERITGLAIGIISVVGYSPDVLLPLINGWITQHIPGMPGYQIYFSYVLVMGSLGVVAALALRRRIAKRSLA
ncbi:MFS transporter [Dyella acidiphila]|uniref:MFS transporter n=1 Tax=Dyella acidiphila TaxID=2775866 RepID=A0ABR9G6M2_9GAMM|nr:MFS transporter [Dyella acidiphila]MBE1159657.1 MFS transporter [Dyella acidiphila]